MSQTGSATLTSVCVYCGSSFGVDPSYERLARDFGTLLGRKGIELVYGGGSVGLMGAVARSALEAGGTVTGVIPKFLIDWEVELRECTNLIQVETMHERKAAMFERADAFVVLPGGLGTLEEVAEVLAWAQMKLHAKPVILWNIRRYWTPLLDLFDHMVDYEFAKHEVRKLWRSVETLDELLPNIEEALSELGTSEGPPDKLIKRI